MQTLIANIFTGPFLVTVIRYGLNAVGVWLVANGYLAEDTWQVIGGALLSIVMALMGGADSVKDKIVSHGRTVSVDTLPINVRQQIEGAARTSPKRNLISILFGR